MHEQVSAALDQQDYRRAAKLLKQWRQESPKDPWMMVCVGRLQEETNRLEAAEATYRKVLQGANNAKVMAQARQGLQRLEQQAESSRQQALAAAKAEPGSDQTGLLLLVPVKGEDRKAAAQGLAKVMKIDPYAAQLKIPGKAWRLYRVGPIGELEFYGQSLRQANTPAFWVKLADINTAQIFRVCYFRSVTPQVTVVCQNQADQLGEISFDWSEVSQRVTGLLPIFEQVVDRGAWGKLERKERTQDYAQMLDLHLQSRQCILRLCDRTYQFQQVDPFNEEPLSKTPGLKNTTRINWNNLLNQINQRVACPIWSDFNAFAEGALEYIDLLHNFNPHINLFRSEPSNWDPAFHLYSGLIFLQRQQD
ncbi:MAG: tetratricopeptide repeat protein [Leptolyngbyaceae cyanobacterium MO_188.B28]|nr:tetratricopeptide repeat protein [Leptolyngbyaceae cyanobacterium MO_188.B28]